MAKKFFVEASMFMVIILTMAVVAISGALAYKGLITVLNSAKEESNTNNKLLLLRKIFSSVADAENNIRSFSLTRDSDYLTPFYNSVKEVDQDIDRLNLMFAGNREELDKVAQLSFLIEKKYRNFNKYLFLHEEEAITASLEKASAKLKKQPKKAVATPSYTYKQDSSSVTNNISEETTPKKSNLFAKIFRRKQKAPVRADVDSDYVPPIYTPAEDIKANNNISLKQIESELKKVKSEQVNILRNVRMAELEITRTDKVISSELRTLAASLEHNLIQSITAQKQNLETKLAETNKAVALFCILAALLLIIVIVTIVRYLKKNHAYENVLKTAKENAEHLAEAKELFLANMSHELRTPMTAIIGFSEQLSQTALNKEQERSASIINQSANHLLGIINDLLDYSKLQSGKSEIEKTPFNLPELIEETLALIKPLAKNKQIKLLSEINKNVPSDLIGDKTKIKQILINVLGNAIKFTEEGEVKLKVSALIINNIATVRLYTTDTGIGIPQHKLQRIFNEFEQAEISTTRKYGGTGLGLSITKKLVEIHNGQINIDSTINKGTGVEIIINFEIAKETQAPVYTQSSPDTTTLHNISVLIVDDERFNRELLKTILSKWQVKYEEAASAKEGIEKTKSVDFDVILMDIRMEGMNGIEATSKIRKRGFTNPIIALTAATTQSDMIAYKQAGINEVLSKPFKEKALLEILIKTLHLDNGQLGQSFADTEKNDAGLKENLPLFDLSPIYEIAGSDHQFVMEMIGAFLKSSEEASEKIIEAAQKNNWEQIAYYTHKLVAPARHIKANKVSELLEELENNVKEKKHVDDYASEAIKILEKEILELNRQLQEESKKIAEIIN